MVDVVILGKTAEVFRGSEFLPLSKPNDTVRTFEKLDKKLGVAIVTDEEKSRVRLVERLITAICDNLHVEVIREIKRQVSECPLEPHYREGDFKDIAFRVGGLPGSVAGIQFMVEAFLKAIAENFTNDDEELQRFNDLVRKISI